MDIREFAEQQLGECIWTIREMAKSKSPEYKEVLEASDEDLPNLIGEDDLADMVIERRLKGEPVDDHDLLITEVLSNCEFDYDDFYNIGVNDGKLFMLVKIFEILDDDEKVQECYNWIYRD